MRTAFLCFGIILCQLGAGVLPSMVAAAPSETGSQTGGYPGTSPAALKPSEYRKAVKLIEEERFAEAIPLLLKALAKSPDDPDILNYLGFTHRKTGKLDEALAYYKQALALAPEHRAAREYLGELYLQRAQLDLAEAELKELERLCPEGCEERTALEAAITAYKATPAQPPP